MKIMKIMMLLVVLSSAMVSFAGCAMSGEERRETRQSTRTSGRVEERQEERRGFD